MNLYKPLWVLSYFTSILIGIILIVALIDKLVGHSPTITDLMIGLQVFTIATLFSYCVKFEGFKEKVGEFMTEYRQKVETLTADIKMVQKEVITMHYDIKELSKDVAELRHLLSKKRAI